MTARLMVHTNSALQRRLRSHDAEHRGVMRLQHLAVAEIHVHAAGQARIEAANGAHDIDSLEFVGAIFLEDRRVLHRILIRSRSAVAIARIGIPGSWRIGVIVGDLVILDHHVMRQDAAHRFVEAAADRFFGNLEVVPGPGAAGVQLCQRLLGKIECGGSGVRLEVSASAIALNGIAPLGNLPLELDLGERSCLGQIDFHAVAGGS